MRFNILLVGTLLLSCSQAQNSGDIKMYSASDERFIVVGGGLRSGDSVLMEWSGSGIRFTTSASEVIFHMRDISHGADDEGEKMYGHYAVLENGNIVKKFQGNEEQEKYTISGLGSDTKEVTLLRLNEPMVSKTIFTGIQLPENETFTQGSVPSGQVLVIGNSITTGYGNMPSGEPCHFSPETQDFSSSYVFHVSESLGAELTVRAWSGKGLVTNYDRTTSNTMRDLYSYHLPYAKKEADELHGKFNLAIIHLGTNDFAHTIPEESSWTSVYETLIKELSTRYDISKFILLGGPTIQDRQDYPALTALETYLNRIMERTKQYGISVETHLFQEIQGARAGCDAHPDSLAHREMAEALTNKIVRTWPELKK